MGEIVNLRRVRKAKARADAAEQAAENRVRHGRTKSERAGTTKECVIAERALDAARLVEPTKD